MAGSVSRCLGTVVAIICITWCGVASTTDQGHQEAGSFISSTWDTFQNTSTLYKRDDYEDCRRKGEAVQCILNGRSPNPPGSPWTDYAALQHYGWGVVAKAEEPPENFGSLFKDFGMVTDENKWTWVDMDHIFDFTNNDGQEGEATDALYHCWYSAPEGAIIIGDARSPRNMVELGGIPVDGPFPDLQRLSDLVWLEWAHLCEEQHHDPADLKLVIRSQIYTEKTKAVIQRVVELQGHQSLPQWPGLEISTLTPSGLALLGTAHGLGVARMLIDRRATSPSIQKTVASTVLFRTEDDRQTHMAVKLGPLGGQ